MARYCQSKPGLNFTFVHPAFYFENFLSYFPPQPNGDGTFSFGFPQGTTPLAGIAIEDLGGIVAPVFSQPQTYIGKTVGAVTVDLTGAEYAEQMSEVLGIKVTYNDIPRDVFASFGFPGAEDLANMFTLNKLYITSRKEEMEESHRLFPGFTSFAQWMKENKQHLNQSLKNQRPLTNYGKSKYLWIPS